MTLAKTTADDATQSSDSSPQLQTVQAFTSEIAENAYFKAESRGFIPGYELSDWLEAEQALSVI